LYIVVEKLFPFGREEEEEERERPFFKSTGKKKRDLSRELTLYTYPSFF